MEGQVTNYQNFPQDLGQTNWLSGIMYPLQSCLDTAYQTIFNSVQGILFNGVAYTLIILIIIYWLLNRLKTGYPSKDEIFEAGKWMVITLLIYAVFYSFEGYKGFISLFLIPQGWVKGAVSSIFDMKSQGNFEDLINQAFDLQNQLAVGLWKVGQKQNGGTFTPNSMAAIYTGLSLFFYGLYYIVFFIALIGATCIIIGAQFIASLILSTAPIVIPFLVIKPLKSYFYSWLKLFISYSLYPSIALIILNIAMKPIQDIKNYQGIGDEAIKNAYENNFSTFFPMTLLTIFCIYLFTKIPNWVSQIMGVQGLDSGGVGAGLSIAKNAGLAAATGGVSGVMTKVAGGSFFAGAARGALGTLPGAKTLGGIKDAVAKRMSNGKGATASAE